MIERKIIEATKDAEMEGVSEKEVIAAHRLTCIRYSGAINSLSGRKGENHDRWRDQFVNEKERL